MICVLISPVDLGETQGINLRFGTLRSDECGSSSDKGVALGD